MPHNGSPWTPADDQILREMWEKKILVREIATKLNRSRSAIVGRAHRLSLEKRENPIKNRKYYSSARRKSPSAPTPKPAIIHKPPKRVNHPWNARKMPEGRNAPTLVEGPPVEEPVRGVGGSWSRCQFIAGETDGPNTLYCGQPVTDPKKVYCAYHQQICFTVPRVKPEKNDVA